MTFWQSSFQWKSLLEFQSMLTTVLPRTTLTWTGCLGCHRNQVKTKLVHCQLLAVLSKLLSQPKLDAFNYIIIWHQKFKSFTADYAVAWKYTGQDHNTQYLSQEILTPHNWLHCCTYMYVLNQIAHIQCNSYFFGWANAGLFPMLWYVGGDEVWSLLSFWK